MTKTDKSDVWDQDPPGGRAGSTFVRRTPNMKAVQTKVVRDDWDDDDEDEEGEGGETKEDGNAARNDSGVPGPCPPGSDADEDSTQIWEEANRRAPMPELVVASSSTTPSFVPPPPSTLQPMLRILKRPSPAPLTSSSDASSGTTSPLPRSTLAEREAQYQEARSRIFGEKERPGGVVVLRDPLGPASEPEPDKAHGPGRPAKGFGDRRRGKK